MKRREGVRPLQTEANSGHTPYAKVYATKAIRNNSVILS